MRRILLFVAVAVGLVAVVPVPPPASAHHKPGHSHGPTRTTAPTTTTEPAATTTTVAPTTTTEPMPTTTTTIGNCAAPITISTGGTYVGGCYESQTPGVPAVTIATTQPVTLDRVLVRHRSYGIYAQSTTGTNVTVTNSTFQALDPGPTPVNQYALYLLSPASVVFEHNLLLLGHGVLVNGNNVNASPLRFRYNDYLDIGRFNFAELIGAVHFDKVLAQSGAEIAWNRVQNHYGRSSSEDVIGIVNSNGASGNVIEVHHNLIDGSYPFSGDGAGFTGGGIDLADASGSWQQSHDNTVVRVTNNGLMIPAGSNIEHFHNRTITSGIADDGSRVSSTFGTGLQVWDNPGYAGSPTIASQHHSSTNHRRWTGSAWERSNTFMPACDPAGACTNNVSGTFDNANWDTPANGTTLALTDDAAWLAEISDALADWETARAAAGVIVGPLP